MRQRYNESETVDIMTTHTDRLLTSVLQLLDLQLGDMKKRGIDKSNSYRARNIHETAQIIWDVRPIITTMFEHERERIMGQSSPKMAHNELITELDIVSLIRDINDELSERARDVDGCMTPDERISTYAVHDAFLLSCHTIRVVWQKFAAEQECLIGEQV